MKKIIFILFISIIGIAPLTASARTLQVGGDLIIPYRVDSPSGKLETLWGGHGELFLNDNVAADIGAFFGDTSTYIVPGASLYLPSPIFNPFVQANLPILVNNGKDIGIQGGAGLLWNVLAGLGLKYQVDVAYYFDAHATVVNWVHAGACFTF
jgi:hypothetical protein